MRNFFGVLFFAMVLCVGVGVPTEYVGAALGVSPSRVIAEVVRGTKREYSVTIVRSPQDIGELTIQVKAEGENASLISFDENVLKMSEKQNQIGFRFSVDPKERAVGSYTADLVFLNITNNIVSGANAVTVTTGVGFPVFIEITGQEREEYSLRSSECENTEVGSALRCALSVFNSGNVDFKPGSLKLIIENKQSGEISEQYIEGSVFSFIAPSVSASQSRFNIPHKILEGEYRLSFIYFDKNGVEIKQFLQEKFKVFPVGTFKQKGSITSLKTNKEAYKKGEKIKFDSLFKNEGEVGVKAILIASISKNGEIIDLIRGKEFFVDVGSEMLLTEFFSLPDEGEYDVETYVEYGNRRTDSRILKVVVDDKTAKQLEKAKAKESKGQSGTSMRGNVVKPIMLSVILLSVLGGGFLFWKKNHTRLLARKKK